MPTDNQHNPWRYRCPRGHTGWKNRTYGYYCDQCKVNGVEPRFEELVDAMDA